MNTQAEAYLGRRKKVHADLLELADKFTLDGATVLRNRELTTFLIVLYGGKHVCVQWGEVPYRFDTYRMRTPSKTMGSSETIDTTPYLPSFERLKGSLCPYPKDKSVHKVLSDNTHLTMHEPKLDSDRKYVREQLAPLDTSKPISVQLRDYDGKATKWMLFSKTLIEEMQRKFDL